MKKIFDLPEIDVMYLGKEDVITTSPEAPYGEDNHGNLTSLSEELQKKYLEAFWEPEYWATMASPHALCIEPATSDTKPH